jgi:hypothetical protein
MNRPVPKNEDLHGNAPDSCPVVLLLLDVLNDLEDFPGNSQLLKSAESLGKNIADLKKRCDKSGIPSIYVNDNRGKWRSDFSVVLSRCLRAASPGLSMVSQAAHGLGCLRNIVNTSSESTKVQSKCKARLATR